MRYLVATVCAGLAGVLALAEPHPQPTPSSRTPPSGRARAHKRDGGASEATAPDGGSGRQLRAQQKPRILGDAPGSFRLTNTPGAPDAGVPVSTRVDKLEQQVKELRTRATALEAALRRSQEQEQTLEQMNQQLSELRGQVAAEAQRKQQAEAQHAAQQQRVGGAVSGLLSAEDALAGGNTDIGPALDAAAQAFTGAAARDVADAREALRNDDLSQARYLLQSAIDQAQQSAPARPGY